MDPITVQILSSWDFRPWLLLLFAGFGALYTAGWWRLRRKGRGTLSNGWRLFAYWLAIVTIIIALMSPIEVLSSQLFTFHMIQHLLLNMIAAPLIMLANPMPFLLWGIPTHGRQQIGGMLTRALHRDSKFRTAVRSATTPGLCWLYMVMVLWGWHDPNLYNAALRSNSIHDFEHFTFFFTSLLFWWHATGSGPRIHKQMPRLGRIAYLLAGVPSTMAPGIVISFSSKILYTFYETMPRLPGALNMSVATDQILAGIIMWVPGSMMYIAAALVIIARWLQYEEGHKTVPTTAVSPPAIVPAPLQGTDI